MQIRELGHVVLFVRNLERSAHFYRDVLGFRAIETPERMRGTAMAFSSGRTHHELLLIAAGDHPERLRSEAAWAHMCAVAPIPASSGKTRRRRLNRGGNREASHALWRIVITRMSAHPATRAYVQRRTAEGLSKKEIIRCLKRYVAREVYRHLRPAA